MAIRNQYHFHQRAVCVLGASLFVCAQARAVIFAPGAPAASTPGTATFAGLTVLGDETTSVTGYDASNDARYTASVESQVLESPGGTLDFAYQITNTSPISQPDSLHTISLLSYRNFTTDIDYVSGTGTVTYDTAQRIAAGNGISVSLDYTPAVNAIAAGDSTDWILIETNATSYDNQGQTTLIDGATANVVSFEPAVPEPISLGLLGLGGIALVHRRPDRRRK